MKRLQCTLHVRTWARCAVRSISLATVLFGSGPAAAVDVFYSFRNDDGGGAAKLTLDPATGAVQSHEIIFEQPMVDRARKLALCEAGRYLILTSTRSGRHNLFITDLRANPPRTAALVFPSEPDEVRTFGSYAIVGGDSGHLCVVDLAGGRIVSRWNSRGTLVPSGHKPEDIHILPGGQRAIVSFQKDTRGGKHYGSRVVVIELPDLRVVNDLQLPRNRPDLHIPGSNRERGPNPEVVIASPGTNTLFLSLDLYGAVALADLDAALERGMWSRLVYLPTAVDESWGNSFPDRMIHFAAQDREYVLVCNAGADGGSVLVDLRKRSIVARIATPFGLETPTRVPGLDCIVAAAAGKLKSRGDVELEEHSRPSRELWVFDTGSLEESGEMSVEMIPMDMFVFRIVPIDASSGLLCLLAGEREPDTLVIYDLKTRSVVSTTAAKGVMQRTAGQ